MGHTPQKKSDGIATKRTQGHDKASCNDRQSARRPCRAGVWVQVSVNLDLNLVQPPPS